jgi:hypothetical protein
MATINQYHPAFLSNTTIHRKPFSGIESRTANTIFVPYILYTHFDIENELHHTLTTRQGQR